MSQASCLPSCHSLLFKGSHDLSFRVHTQAQERDNICHHIPCYVSCSHSSFLLSFPFPTYSRLGHSSHLPSRHSSLSLTEPTSQKGMMHAERVHGLNLGFSDDTFHRIRNPLLSSAVNHLISEGHAVIHVAWEVPH